MQEDHEPLALQPPLVARMGGEDVRVHERAEEALLRVGQDEAVHRGGGPADGLEVVDEESAPDFAVEGVAEGEGRAEHGVRVVGVVGGEGRGGLEVDCGRGQRCFFSYGSRRFRDKPF